MAFRPTATQLADMKRPLGHLLKGNTRETMAKLVGLVRETKPAKITTVGDTVSEEAMKAGIHVNLRIVDHRTMRKPIESTTKPSNREFSLTNPAGVITDEAFSTIHAAMAHQEALIIVEGEEDLLTIPAVLESPDNSLVVYGQPMEGVVVITVTPRVKQEVSTMLDKMIREDS